MYKYCLDCGWQCSSEDGHSERDVSRRAIEHFVATGHTIESLRLPPPVVIES